MGGGRGALVARLCHGCCATRTVIWGWSQHADPLLKEQVTIGGKTWPVYSVGGSPAQAVQHGVLELSAEPPDLVVAGINYGENLTVSVTISGTVGAAKSTSSE